MALLPHALLHFPHPQKVLPPSSPCCRPSQLQTEQIWTPGGEQPSPPPPPPTENPEWRELGRESKCLTTILTH